MDTSMSATRTAKKHLHMNISIPQTARFKESDNFLELPYDELYERNIKIKRERDAGKTSNEFKSEMLEVLKSEAGIKAVTLCFSDLEGKLHMLDYNKEFMIDSHENLTFDGSSINGFTALNKSDLRLKADWSSFRWLPADVFGTGKVMMFANVHDQDGTHYAGDYRSQLSVLRDQLKTEKGITVNLAPEIEGFLMDGTHAEQSFDEASGFKLATESGYFNALPQDQLRMFIDHLAESTRAMAYENEKDHPEVAPAQFEMNYRFTDVLHAADQIQLYKVTARQIAKNMGLTASFLPKPTAGINGNGMHSNMSLSKDGLNLFYDGSGKDGLSSDAHHFINGVLSHGKDICLILNSSVNSYRRLDPNFEAPNEIKTSASDRGSMIRVPLANEKSARIEVRTVAPDANPYLSYYAILKAGLSGMFGDDSTKTKYSAIHGREIEMLPATIQEAIWHFEKSDFIREVLSEDNRDKYLELKKEVADRSPVDLGAKVKNREVLDHHEIRNQVVWSDF